MTEFGKHVTKDPDSQHTGVTGVCVCVCMMLYMSVMRTHECVGTCSHVCACGGQSRILDVFFLCSSSSYLETGSLAEIETLFVI